MNESFEIAKGELKRADHLMYVSLKYTRTVDVLRSLVERLITTYDALILSLLRQAGLSDPPRIPRLRVEMVRKNYSEDIEILSHMNLYCLLRDISKAPYDSKREFRRHVTMVSHLDDKEIEITIDIIDDYFKKVRGFVGYVGKLLEANN